MSARVRFEGLDELREALRSLPDDLRDDAGQIVLQHAEDAANQVRLGYRRHRVTGTLEDRVTVNRDAGRFSARAQVRSRAPHAHLFEDSISGRSPTGHWKKPNTDQAIPIFIRARRNMVAALIRMVEAAGLKVTSS